MLTSSRFSLLPFARLGAQAFECPHCHERNSEVQFAGLIGEKGRKYALRVEEGDLRSLNRQLVKSDFATLRVPELEFEIQAGTQKAQLTTVEGIMSSAAKNLAAGQDERRQQYPEVAEKIDAFIAGTTHFLVSLSLSPSSAAALVAMVVVSFALTTLDSATRLLRFNLEEMGSMLGLHVLRNRFLSSAIACLVIAIFAFYEVEVHTSAGVVRRPAGLALWQLFGTTNQLLAGLTLLLATLYLRARQRPTWPTGIPALFMLLSTMWAMVQNLRNFDDPLLLGLGVALLLLGLGVLAEAVLALLKPAAPPSEGHDRNGEGSP